MSGKGDTPRKVDRKKWDDCPLWDNMKNKPHDPWDDFPDVHGPADEFTFLSPEERAEHILANYRKSKNSPKN